MDMNRIMEVLNSFGEEIQNIAMVEEHQVRAQITNPMNPALPIRFLATDIPAEHTLLLQLQDIAQIQKRDSFLLPMFLDINYLMPRGSIGVDLHYGEVRFQTAHLYDDGEPGSRLLERLIGYLLQHIQTLQKIIFRQQLKDIGIPVQDIEKILEEYFGENKKQLPRNQGSIKHTIDAYAGIVHEALCNPLMAGKIGHDATLPAWLRKFGQTLSGGSLKPALRKAIEEMLDNPDVAKQWIALGEKEHLPDFFLEMAKILSLQGGDDHE